MNSAVNDTSCDLLITFVAVTSLTISPPVTEHAFFTARCCACAVLAMGVLLLRVDLTYEVLQESPFYCMFYCARLRCQTFLCFIIQSMDAKMFTFFYSCHIFNVFNCVSKLKVVIIKTLLSSPPAEKKLTSCDFATWRKSLSASLITAGLMSFHAVDGK